MSTPISRDYKRSGRRSSLAFRFGKEFFVGLGLGLMVAIVVFVVQQKLMRTQAALADAQPRANPSTTARSVAETPDDSTPQYDFYDRLAKQDVPITDRSKDVKRELPNAPIERPGTYVLQLGSYRNPADAERLRAQLAKLGVTAEIQAVAANGEDFKRVRIGPMNNLVELNRIRATLNSADLPPEVTRVGD